MTATELNIQFHGEPQWRYGGPQRRRPVFLRVTQFTLWFSVALLFTGIISQYRFRTYTLIEILAANCIDRYNQQVMLIPHTWEKDLIL
jgi:hypothetical protein